MSEFVVKIKQIIPAPQNAYIAVFTDCDSCKKPQGFFIDKPLCLALVVFKDHHTKKLRSAVVPGDYCHDYGVELDFDPISNTRAWIDDSYGAVGAFVKCVVGQSDPTQNGAVPFREDRICACTKPDEVAAP